MASGRAMPPPRLMSALPRQYPTLKSNHELFTLCFTLPLKERNLTTFPVEQHLAHMPDGVTVGVRSLPTSRQATFEPTSSTVSFCFAIV